MWLTVGADRDAGCGSCVSDDRCEICRGRAPEERGQGDTMEIGNTRGCFKRQETSGVCGPNSVRIKIRTLRRGRSPSGCNHSLKPVRPTESIVSGWPAFSSKKSLLPHTSDLAPCSSGIKTLISIYSRSCAAYSIALKMLHGPVLGKILFLCRDLWPKPNPG